MNIVHYTGDVRSVLQVPAAHPVYILLSCLYASNTVLIWTFWTNTFLRTSHITIDTTAISVNIRLLPARSSASKTDMYIITRIRTTLMTVYYWLKISPGPSANNSDCFYLRNGENVLPFYRVGDCARELERVYGVNVRSGPKFRPMLRQVASGMPNTRCAHRTAVCRAYFRLKRSTST